MYHSFLGKERIFTAIAQEIKAKIWGSTEKVRVLKTLSDPIIDSNLTRISCDAQIHVVEMHKVHSVRFHEILIRKFLQPISILKFVFSKKATKIDEIFTVDLTFTS